ncbi:MAG: hypothetical protein P0Y60_13260 [Candidatus Microbacterium colombiense]|nr:MAG: hypothetical protein P0Y60_13260 [Microbacterium sp.]
MLIRYRRGLAPLMLFIALPLVLAPVCAAAGAELPGDARRGSLQTASSGPTITSNGVMLTGCEGIVDDAMRTASAEQISAGKRQLCTGTETISERRFTLGEGEATAVARELGMSSTEAESFVSKAAAGSVHGATWKHSYSALLVVEIHTGTTYWDGTKAWVSTYRGLTGKHSCHVPGGWQYGGTVSGVKCNRPGPSTKADAVERFDLNALIKGFPVTLNIGLHYAITNKGVTSSWQVGG